MVSFFYIYNRVAGIKELCNYMHNQSSDWIQLAELLLDATGLKQIVRIDATKKIKSEESLINYNAD